MTAVEAKSEDTIIKDVKRTNFCMSQKQELTKLLRRVSLNFPKTGYYQGMNCIGGFLLKYTGSYKTSLRIFNYLMERRLSKYFKKNFKHAKQLFYVCEQLLEIYIPECYRYMKSIGLLSDMYLMKNHLTLYTSILQHIQNFTLTANIIDMVISEGWGGFFKVIIFFFKKFEHKIIKMNYEKALRFLQEDIYQSLININLETFKDDIATIRIPKNLMLAIEYQYVDTGATVETFWQEDYEKRKSSRKTPNKIKK